MHSSGLQHFIRYCCIFQFFVVKAEDSATTWTWVPDRSMCPRHGEGPLLNPAFLLIGAEKSGTTSLYHYLGRHPFIRLVAKKKEPYSLLHVLVDGVHNVSLNHYHHLPPLGQAATTHAVEVQANDAAVGSSPNMVESQAWKPTSLPPHGAEEAYYEYVERAFGDAVLLRSGEATFEASPRYYTYPELARPLLRVLPCTRVVMTLREPLRRAESQYWHDICTPGYQNRLIERPFSKGLGGTTSAQPGPADGLPPGFMPLEHVLGLEVGLWKACTTSHGSLPTAIRTNTDSSSKLEAQRRVRVLWSCLSTPVLVNRTTFSERRVYFGYLIPGLYALPLEQWLDAYPRELVHFMDFDSWTDKGTAVEALDRLTHNFLGLPKWPRESLAKTMEVPRKFMAAPCFSKTGKYRKLGESFGNNGKAISQLQINREQAFLADVRKDILRPANALLAELIDESWNWI